MLKIEKEKVVGLEVAVRGMRNPMNSWEQSDSGYCAEYDECDKCPAFDISNRKCLYGNIASLHEEPFAIGPKDFDLMERLRAAGTDHRKFMRMIVVYWDITAPLYWWKEFDTYKVGTVANSCSTMHKIHAKEFTLDDFSHEHLMNMDDGDAFSWEDYPIYAGENWSPNLILQMVIKMLNFYRKKFIETKDKKYWWQMIQLLPSSYNQKRTVMLNYEVLANIYRSRRGHKLDEWHTLCDWIEELPYSHLITGEAEENDDTQPQQ